MEHLFVKESLQQFLYRFETTDYVLFTVALLLVLLARPLVKFFYKDAADEGGFLLATNIFRGLGLVIFTVLGYLKVYLPTGGDRGIALKVISIVIVLYLSYLILHVARYVIRQRYGKTREVSGEVQISDTYNSRMLTLFATIFITVIALIAVVQVAGFDSLLQAGGVIGFVGVFLALTQAAWAPDVFSGLIILNSNMVDEGDVIQLNGLEDEPIIGTVFKTRVFHTELLNLVNNHRMMIRNAKLRDQMVHNLSKFASAKGLRERLTFSIGYDADKKAVTSMFEKAFASAAEQKDIPYEDIHPVQIRITEFASHGIEWSVYYYVKSISQIINIRQLILQEVLIAATEADISLATPLTHTIISQDEAE